MNKKILFLIMAAMFSLLSCFDLLDTYENNAAFNLGDRGPAGGWIFYINPNWKTDGWRYLEAAPEDQSHNAPWRETASTVIVTQDGLGKGYGDINTKNILGVADYGNYCAAKICDDLVLGGYDDWYLPTILELNYMNLNLYQKGLGNFTNLSGDQEYYWSSLRYSVVVTQALNHHITDSIWNLTGNASPQGQATFRTRAVRYF